MCVTGASVTAQPLQPGGVKIVAGHLTQLNSTSFEAESCGDICKSLPQLDVVVPTPREDGNTRKCFISVHWTTECSPVILAKASVRPDAVLAASAYTEVFLMHYVDQLLKHSLNHLDAVLSMSENNFRT